MKRADGSWTDISTAVQANPDGTFVAANNPLRPEFATSADDAAVLSVSNGSSDLSFSLLDAESSSYAHRSTPAGGERNSQVTYDNAVAGGADLHYEVGTSSVKETIELEQVPTEADAHWSWRVKASGLNLVKNDLGDLRFVTSDGTAKFVIPAPVMWDSSTQVGVREAAEHSVDTSIIAMGDGSWKITLAADHDWLAGNDRVYPVYIDPTTQYGDANQVSYRSDGLTRTDKVRVGNSRDSNLNTYWRSRVVYDYSSLYGKQVTDAIITAVLTDGDTAFRGGSINTISGAGYNSLLAPLSTFSVDTFGNTPVGNTDLPQKLSDWVNDGSQHTLMIRGAETPGVLTYKALSSTLKIAWKEFPAVTGRTTPAPVNGGTTGRNPVLAVTSTNPGTGGISLQYVVGTSPDPDATSVYMSDWAEPGDYLIPSGVLNYGATYYWRVHIKDSYDNLFGTSTENDGGPVWSFSVTNSTPSIPVLDGISPSDASVVPLETGINPLFMATSDDSDGDVLTTVFESRIADSTSSDMCTSAPVPSGEMSGCSPTAPLIDGAQYQLRQKSSDGIATSAWSEWSTFTASNAIPASVPEATIVEVPFDHSVTIADAVSFASSANYDVLSFRFESDDVVGEWSPTVGQSSAAFLSDYQATYGTVPEVVGLTVASASGGIPSSAAAPAITNKPTFHATAASSQAVDDFDAMTFPETSAAVAGGKKVSAPSHGWNPVTTTTAIYHAAKDGGKSVKFDSYYGWNGVNTDPSWADTNFGFEFETNIHGTKYNEKYKRCTSYGPCPFQGKCLMNLGGQPEKQTFAQQNGWSWSVFVKKDHTAAGANGTKSNLGAYADYNDLWNSCNITSIAVGLRDPQNIPISSGKTKKLWIHINAPKGVEASGTIAGNIQAVERETCAAAPAMTNTDCMGANIYFPWTGPGERFATTLARKRFIVAPSACWKSGNYQSSYTDQTLGGSCIASPDPWS